MTLIQMDTILLIKLIFCVCFLFLRNPLEKRHYLWDDLKVCKYK